MLWSERDEHTLRSLYALGTPIRKIARIFNRSKHSILNKARRLSLEWGGVKQVAAPRVQPHEDPIILTYAEERALKRPRTPSSQRGGGRSTPAIMEQSVTPWVEDTPNRLKPLKSTQTAPLLPADECTCAVATGSGMTRGGYTICLKCRLPRKRV